MDYNRMVTYIYSYNGRIKGRNTGFARMEIRQGMLKLQINMKCAFSDNGLCWDVNLFYRDGGRIIPIKLGSMRIHNGEGEFRYASEAADIGMSGYGFSQICGLYVSSEGNDKIFASEWDDMGFDPENISRIVKDGYIAVECETASFEPLVLESSAIESEEEQEEVLADTNNDSGVEQLLSERDIKFIFSDDELYDCVEIEPKDISKLSDTNWGLMNNSFVNHGYYNYRHLLLGRIDNGNTKGYFIGIPGVYTRRERNTAAMFGFNNFKFSMRADAMYDQFGYWYKRLEN